MYNFSTKLLKSHKSCVSFVLFTRSETFPVHPKTLSAYIYLFGKMYLNENIGPPSVSAKGIVATEGKVLPLLSQELNKENGGDHWGI